MPELLHIEAEQYSEQWWNARMGIPTCSEFHTVLAQGRKKGEPSVTRAKYMRRLAAERLWGVRTEPYTNPHLERGRAMEGEACDFYAFSRDCEPKACGFFRLGDKGGSPDRLIADDGILSVKTALPDILIDYILKDQFPLEHKAQAQGELWITGRAWLDIIIYWPGCTPFIKRCEPDPQYILNLAEEIERFNYELDEIVQRVRRYGAPSTLKADLQASLIAHDAMLAQAQEAPPWTP